jgi:hypothetical protein
MFPKGLDLALCPENICMFVFLCYLKKSIQGKKAAARTSSEKGNDALGSMY